MTADEQYVPSEQDLEVAWIESEASADGINVASAEFDRFLARVRRDAAREALDGAEEYALRRHEMSGYALRADGWRFASDAVRDYRDTHYPEESP